MYLMNVIVNIYTYKDMVIQIISAHCAMLRGGDASAAQRIMSLATTGTGTVGFCIQNNLFSKLRYAMSSMFELFSLCIKDGNEIFVHLRMEIGKP